ncbi:hypothetical protein [Rhizobium alvei]|jgi:hypothetical protein|uniref:Uncharacterized protein n=1 Tax=Rhizobium alvei TaxID=1132659 RepID=A0ABT8YK31_9HYPH|nr:hypothetical protein [Rhizobium alvei]MDO6963971.1 hypothetical protein [Rhizobium alvei]
MDKQVIEFAGEPVGIAVPENGKLKFIAVKFHVMDLDNNVYRSVEDVETAIAALPKVRPDLHAW